MLKSEPIICRICKNAIETSFCDLGLSPLANSYLTSASEIAQEKRYPLHARVCGKCLLVQLPALETPEHIFSDYAYFSSYSSSWLAHSRAYAEEMIARLNLNRQSLVVEVASNDGYLLQYFVEKDIPVLGIEPAANVAEEARRTRGVRTEVRFFGERTARELRDKYGAADLALGNNVIAHVPDLHDFIEGFRIMVKPGGVATFEFPHILQLINHGQFDTIYHEHFSYLSLYALERAFREHGLVPVDIQELPTHGGSLRLFVAHEDGAKASAAVEAMREKERAHGLLDLTTYTSFQKRADDRRKELRAFLDRCKTEGTRVVGYGAPAKGNTLLNFCGVAPSDIAYTVDRNPHKQNRLLPGTHIPTHSPQKIFEDKPDIVLILPWNLKEEISKEMEGIRQWGGRFAVAIPSLNVF